MAIGFANRGLILNSFAGIATGKTAFERNKGSSWEECCEQRTRMERERNRREEKRNQGDGYCYLVNFKLHLQEVKLCSLNARVAECTRIV